MARIKAAHISREGVCLLIPSEGTTGAYFAVERKLIKKDDAFRWTCTCPAWRFKSLPKEDCKHIIDAKAFLKEKMDTNDKRIAPLVKALMMEGI